VEAGLERRVLERGHDPDVGRAQGGSARFEGWASLEAHTSA
jgi:hypothetical protein